MNDSKGQDKQLNLGRQLRGNAAILLPALYLLASGIGMLDSWWYYRQFGINIFYYSDISDFLLASFRSPTAWLVVILSLGLFSIEYRASLRDSLLENPGRLRRIRGSSLYRTLSWLCLVPMVAAYILIYANMRADGILVHGLGQPITVALATENDTRENGTLLGSSLNFIFILAPDHTNVQVHPYDNVITVSSAVAGIQTPQTTSTETEHPLPAETPVPQEASP